MELHRNKYRSEYLPSRPVLENLPSVHSPWRVSDAQRVALLVQNVLLTVFHSALAFLTLRVDIVDGVWTLSNSTSVTRLPLCDAFLYVAPHDAASCPWLSAVGASNWTTTTCEEACELEVKLASTCAQALPYRAWAVAFFVLSAFFHFGNAVLWRARYYDGIAEARNPARWIEYSMSATCMYVCLAWPLGMQDTVKMACGAMLIFTTMLFGELTEDACRPKENADEWAESNLWKRLKPHLFGYVPQVTAWVGLIVAATRATEVFGGGDDAGYGIYEWVKTAAYTQCALFFSFGFVQLWLICSSRPRTRYVRAEYAYNALSLLSKGVLGFSLVSQTAFTSFFDEIYGADGLLNRIDANYQSGVCVNETLYAPF